LWGTAWASNGVGEDFQQAGSLGSRVPERHDSPPKRPEEKSDAAQINVAFSQELLGAMDAWIAAQPDRPVRPEEIRHLVSAALGLTRPQRSARPKEPHFEPSPEQIKAIDRYRAGIELSRVDAISLLADVGLRRVRSGNMD
jgi:hypothetical protein